MSPRKSVSLAFIAVVLAGSAAAQTSKITPELSQLVDAEIKADASRLETIFKDIHQNPELGFMEVRTAGIVARELQALGYEVKTGIGKTGVVGILRNGRGPMVMYRAEMDANAVAEATGLPYASKVRVKRADGVEVPVAHMCGHDVNLTWMLGTAKVMAALKDRWNGTLIVVAQPAEELIEGAAAMVNDGLYTRHAVPVPQFLLALHSAPGATGSIVARAGTLHAGTDQIDVTFHGVGGHGSTPQFAKDPVVMAATAIMQYQAIVSRVIDPRETAVLTVGSIQAGTDNNVIPDSALLKINLRFFDLGVRAQMISAIRSINNGIARTYGMPEDKFPTMVMKGHSPPQINSKPLIDRLTPTLKGLLGEQQIIADFPATTGSEDAHLLAGDDGKVLVAYMFVGTADPQFVEAARKQGKAVPFTNHNPNYQVDLKAIPVGARIGTMAVLELLVEDASSSRALQ
jgi:amidohydrolase